MATFRALVVKEGVVSGELSLEAAQDQLVVAREELAALENKVVALMDKGRPGKADAVAVLATALRPQVEAAHEFLTVDWPISQIYRQIERDLVGKLMLAFDLVWQIVPGGSSTGAVFNGFLDREGGWQLFLLDMMEGFRLKAIKMIGADSADVAEPETLLLAYARQINGIRSAARKAIQPA